MTNAPNLQEITARRIAGLKKRLAVVGVISAAFLAGGAAIYLGGEAYLESQKQQESQLKAQIGSLRGQSEQMQQDAIEASDAIALNDFLMPQIGTNDFSLSRELLTQRMRVLSEKFHLNEVGVRASGVKESDKNQPQPDALTLATGTPVSIQVELDIRAASDAYIYRFVDSLPVSLAGFVEVKELEIMRDGSLEADTLLAIAQGVKASTVKAKLIFDWYGIRPNPVTPTPEGGADAGAM